MELWVTTPDVHLGKLVHFEVHGKLGNAKIAKKYFLMSKWGVPYTVGKLKNTQIGYLVREIRPRKVLGLKIGNSRECPRATPHDQKGGSCRGMQKHMSGRWCLLLRLGRCEFPSES